MKHYYISTRKPIVSGYARSLLLAVMAALCTLPLAAETDEATGLEFTIETSDPETAAITGIGNCTDIELSIPSTVTAAGKTYTVTRIADDAFYHDMLLYSVVLPESVKEIGRGAFYQSNIGRVFLPEGVETIGASAFAMCNQLRSVTIPESTRSIGIQAFLNNSSLERVYLAGETPVGELAFEAPGQRATLYVPAGTQAAYEASVWADQGFLAIGEYCVGENHDGEGLYYTLDGEEATLADPGAFRGSTLSVASRVGSQGKTCLVTSIGNQALTNCYSLAEAHLPSSIKTINDGAFYYCPGLEFVSISEGLESILGQAFAMCNSLKSISLPASLSSVSADAFSFCRSMESIEVATENSYFTTKDGILYDKAMKTLVAAPGGIVEASVPEGVETIGQFAFFGRAQLSSVELPAGLEKIESAAFYLTSLEEITLPGSLRAIEHGIFGWSSSELPSAIYVEWETPADELAFAAPYYGQTVLYVPRGTKAAYEASAWGEMGYIIEEYDMPTGIEAPVASGNAADAEKLVDVYTADGLTVRRAVRKAEALDGLPTGRVYIVDGRVVCK